MKFPILIHLLNNKARHVVLTEDELPIEHYFKILRTGIDPHASVELEVDYRVKEVDETPQKSDGPSVADSAENGAIDAGSEDISSPSLQEGDTVAGPVPDEVSPVSEDVR